MLELNCTYEESKKIFELGYDFVSVCDRFIEELTRLKKPEYVEKEHFYIEVFRSEVNQHIKDSWIPLIPKAALEACLPKKVGIDNLYFRKFYKTTYSEEEFEVYEAGVNELESNAVIFSSNAIYEMFLWLHENYPAELKAKFDEVMA
jgi:hypothetical protein